MEQDNTLYRIRPLEWEYQQSSAYQCYRADVLGGHYSVECFRYDDKQWSGWRLIVSFDEEYVSVVDVDSPEAGKQLAHEDWLKRILPALEGVKQ